MSGAGTTRFVILLNTTHLFDHICFALSIVIKNSLTYVRFAYVDVYRLLMMMMCCLSQ